MARAYYLVEGEENLARARDIIVEDGFVSGHGRFRNETRGVSAYVKPIKLIEDTWRLEFIGRYKPAIDDLVKQLGGKILALSQERTHG